MKRCRDRFTTIRNSAATCRYFYREVTAQRHSYPLILLLSVLAGAVSPFINIIVPPCIIDELMGGQEIKKLIRKPPWGRCISAFCYISIPSFFAYSRYSLYH